MKKSLCLFIAILLVFTSIIAFSSCDKNETTTCSSCGAGNSVGVKFCSNCGNAFESIENNSNTDNNENQNNDSNTDNNENQNNDSNTDNNENQNNDSNTDNSGTEDTLISTAKDFLNKIASNTTISLSNVNLDFGNVTDSNPCIQKSAEGYYIITNVENLTIVGNETKISSNVNTGLYFLMFDNCKNISISGVNFNSKAPDEDFFPTCLNFENCVGITINDCEFKDFSEGLSFYECDSVIVENSNFNNLNAGAISFLRSNATVSKCNISNINDASCALYCCESTFDIIECNISEIESSYLIFDNTASIFSGKIYDESKITFTNCIIKNNLVGSIFAKSVLGEKSEDYDVYDSYDVYEHTNLKFENCKFNDNIYCYGNTASNNYRNCTMTNNRKAVNVIDFSGWDIDSAKEWLEGINYTIEYCYEDVSSDCRFSSPIITSQSDYGIVDETKNIVLYVSQPAISIQQISIDINSANGVEPSIKFTNNTNKQIAYVYFTIKFYDRMGSPAYCSIYDTHTQRLKVTGPINAGEQETSYWNPVMYNGTTAAMKPLKIEIEFTDRTKQTITCINNRYWYTNSYYGGALRD